MRVERKLVAGEVETVEVQETLERVKDLAKGGNQEYISQYQCNEEDLRHQQGNIKISGLQ